MPAFKEGKNAREVRKGGKLKQSVLRRKRLRTLGGEGEALWYLGRKQEQPRMIHPLRTTWLKNATFDGRGNRGTRRGKTR